MTTRILIGDVREQLKTLADESVHMVCTSPPYYGLRDYGVNGQIGLEATPDEFVAVMVDVFSEVRRVLRKDGTCWVNLGDSYGGAPGNTAMTGGKTDQARGVEIFGGAIGRNRGGRPKDMLGMPWRVAFALQADGWYLRQDIIWAKPNPMPESVKDRCTKAHEYIFLLTKSPRYYFDAEAISESAVYTGLAGQDESGFKDPKNYNGKHGRKIIEGADRGGGHKAKGAGHHNLAKAGENLHTTRNKRSVWEIATSPFPEAHFATFPPELPEICIRAGTSEKGCCGKCGKPWVRETEKGNVTAVGGAAKHDTAINRGVQRTSISARETLTTGWSPSCPCHDIAMIGEELLLKPCTVLDPFGGAGTTGLVADRLQRNAILIELNPEYAAIAKRRIHGDAPMFAEVSS
jgi:DNA modification methylase